jgi:His-Xaa-Ser system protein HxsD
MPPKKPTEVTLTVKIGPDGDAPVLGAAYLLMDRAYVAVEGDRAKSLKISLRAKAGASAASLKEDFARELAAQKLRWAIARNNQPVREHIVEHAVLLANGHVEAAPAGAPPQSAPQDALTDEQRKEIEKLIAEVEDEIKTMNASKAPKDPQNIRASWEEAQEKNPGRP